MADSVSELSASSKMQSCSLRSGKTLDSAPRMPHELHVLGAARVGVATASQPWQYIAGELVEVGVDLEGLAEVAVEGLEHAEDPDCTGASSSSRQENARWSDALSAAALDRRTVSASSA